MKVVLKMPKATFLLNKALYGPNYLPEKKVQCDDCKQKKPYPLFYCDQCGYYRCEECDGKP